MTRMGCCSCPLATNPPPGGGTVKYGLNRVYDLRLATKFQTAMSSQPRNTRPNEPEDCPPAPPPRAPACCPPWPSAPCGRWPPPRQHRPAGGRAGGQGNTVGPLPGLGAAYPVFVTAGLYGTSTAVLQACLGPGAREHKALPSGDCLVRLPSRNHLNEHDCRQAVERCDELPLGLLRVQLGAGNLNGR